MKPLDSSERTLVFDVEANGLLDTVTKIWCIACADLETNQMFLFHDYPEFDGVEGVDEEGNPFTIPVRDGTLKQGALFLHKAKSLVCHNLLGYDLFLLNRFFPKFKIRYNYPEIRDTLLESQVLWFDRPPVKGVKGIHGLAPWAKRFNRYKPEIKDWSFIDALKLHRCIEDIEVNVLVAKQMDTEKAWLKDSCNGIEFDEGLVTEHEYRYWSTIQELNGALVNVPHMQECCVELDGLLEELREEIEPMLPPSIHIKSTRATAHEVATLLGSKKVPNKKIVWIDGKPSQHKTMYRPTMKVHKISKQRMYSVTIAGEEVKGHVFPKVKEARDWAKEAYPKVKGIKYPWIEVESTETDRHTVNHFGDALTSGTEVVGPYTKIRFEKSKMSQHEKVKLLLVTLGWKTDEWTFRRDSEGKFERAPSIGEELSDGTVWKGYVVWPATPIQGKQLRERAKKGERIPATPKITEDSFQWLPEGLGQKIKEYNTYSHRRKFIENPNKDDKGLLNNVREDGRVSCGLMTFGTAVGRASHFNVVNLPSVQAEYGKQMRDIIIAPKGSKLIGVDMPSCHHRYLAGKTGVPEYIAAVDGEEVGENDAYLGEDLHTLNGVLFGLTDSADVELARKTQDHGLIATLTASRKKGKAPGFLCIYGGSDKKLGMTLGIPESDASGRKSNFLSGLGLDELLEDLTPMWNSQKRDRGSYLSTIGGYHIWSNSKHKILNYCAIGAEAVIQKVAIILVSREMHRLGLKSKLVGSFHDECLFEVPEEEIEVMKPLCDMMYQKAAEELKLPLNWKSVSMVGDTYGDCH